MEYERIKVNEDQNIIAKNKEIQANPQIQQGNHIQQVAQNKQGDLDDKEISEGLGSARVRLQCQLKLTSVIDERKDSSYMQAVKKALGELTSLTDGKILGDKVTIKIEKDQEELHKKLDAIEEKYITAIGKCQLYLDKRGSSIRVSPARISMVSQTMAQLQREVNLVSELRKDILENPESYDEYSNMSFLDMACNLRTGNYIEESVDKIELQDYVRMITGREDSIYCKNGKLCRKKAGSKNINEGTATNENFKMADHLVSILMKHQNATTPEQTERIRKNLLIGMGADLSNKVCGPVSMSRILDLLMQFNSYSSDVDRVLCEQKEAAKLSAEEQSLEYRTASKIHKLLGNTYTRKGKETSQDLEARLKGQILAIMDNCQKRKGWSASVLTEEELDYLVKGRLQAVRDKVYNSIMHIYEQRRRLKQDPVKELEEADFKLLLGLTISEIVADKDDIKEALIIQQNRFEESRILAADEGMRKTFKNLSVDSFERINTKALRRYVQTYTDNWKGIPQESREAGLVATIKLINNMQEIRILEHRGLHQGLTAEEVSRFRNRVVEMKSLYWENSENIKLLQQGFVPGTVVYCGIEELEKHFKNGYGGNNFEYCAKKLRKEEKPKKQEVKKEAENQNQDLEQIKEQLIADDHQEKKAIELVTETEALRFATKLLPPKEADFITAVFLDAKPSKLIKDNDTQKSKEIMQLHKAILDLSMAKEPLEDMAKEMSILGIHFTLKQSKSGTFSIKIGTKEMTLPCNAEYWLEMMESDICSNFAKYDQVNAKQLLLDAVKRDNLHANETNEQKRLVYERFLTYHLGIPAEDITNLTAPLLRHIVKYYCMGHFSEEMVKSTVVAANMAQLNKAQINSMAAIESLLALENRKKMQKPTQVIQKRNQLKVENDEMSWTEQEKIFLNLVGDLYFQRGVKEQLNDEKPYDAERLRKVLENRMEDFVHVLNMDYDEREKVSRALESFTALKPALEAINSMIEKIIETGETGRTNLHENENEIKYSGEAKIEKVKKILENSEDFKKGKISRILENTSKSMKQSVDSAATFVQKILAEASKDMTDDTADDSWKKMSDYTIDELIAKGITGDEGEGAFNKLVLSGYIDGVSPADRQKMLAFAFKNAPKLSEKFQERDDAEEQAMGKFLAGYIKGAGPLLHKMLQGLPVSSMPPALQTMVSDVRSNLMEIDEDLVDAQLQSIIDESNGAITKIDKLDVLGAASVGETILVKVYERGKKYGTEKVVKILRPDVQNQMRREIKFMEECATKVDINVRNKKLAAKKGVKANAQVNQQAAAEANGQANPQMVAGAQINQQAPEVNGQGNPQVVLEAYVQGNPQPVEANAQMNPQPVEVKAQANPQVAVVNVQVNQQGNPQPAEANVQANPQVAEVKKQANPQVNGEQQPEGGMLKTFRGKERAIRRELDLRLEADNVLQGQIYEDELLHIRSMKMDKNTKSSIRSLVLEKADGKSVDKFIVEMNTERGHLENAEGSIYETVKKMNEFRAELQNKQQYLNNLLGKWVEEAIFGSGFFHGDLHAGNIMMDENGVTVIDYGNAGRLSKDEQKHILNMLAAVESSNTKRALSHIYDLLPEDSQKIYDKKDQGFKNDLRSIIKMDNGSGVQKILVILNQLQSEDMEIPPALNNFIQCFVRMMGTITDYKTLIANVDESIRKVTKRDINGEIVKNPEKQILPMVLEKLTADNKQVTDKNIKEAVKTAMESKEINVKILDDYVPIAFDNNAVEGYMEKQIRPKTPALFNLMDKAKMSHQIAFQMAQKDAGLFYKIKYGVELEPADVSSFVKWYNSTAVALQAREIGGLKQTLQDYVDRKKTLDLERENAKNNQQLLQDLDREREVCDRQISYYTQVTEQADNQLEQLSEDIKELTSKINQEAPQRAIKIFQDYLNVQRNVAIAKGQDETERTFLKSLFDRIIIAAAPEDAFDSIADVEKANTLKEQMKKDDEDAKKEMEEKAKEINDKSDVKTYREILVEILLDAKECEKLGNSLKKWFEDSTIGGEELKVAYNQLNEARKNGKINKDTEAVKQFLGVFADCISKRSSSILSIANQDKNKQNQKDEEDVLVDVIRTNLDSAKKMLDFRGIPYYHNHKLSEAEKASLKEGKKNRKTDHVKTLFEDMRGSELLHNARGILSCSNRYQSLIQLGKSRVETAQLEAKHKQENYILLNSRAKTLESNQLLNQEINRYLSDLSQKEVEDREAFLVNAIVMKKTLQIEDSVTAQLAEQLVRKFTYVGLVKIIENGADPKKLVNFVDGNILDGDLEKAKQEIAKQSDDMIANATFTYSKVDANKRLNNQVPDNHDDKAKVFTRKMAKAIMEKQGTEQMIRDAVNQMIQSKRANENFLNSILEKTENQVKEEIDSTPKARQEAEQAKEEYVKAQKEFEITDGNGGLFYDERRAKKDLENKLNDEIQVVMQKISTLHLGEVEKRKVENLFKKYENKPSEETLAAIMMEVGNFIDREFKDTAYTDNRQLFNVFDKCLTERKILPKKGTLSLQLEKKMDDQGKPITLIDRLRNKEKIKWIVGSEQ